MSLLKVTASRQFRHAKLVAHCEVEERVSYASGTPVRFDRTSSRQRLRQGEVMCYGNTECGCQCETPPQSTQTASSSEVQSAEDYNAPCEQCGVKPSDMPSRIYFQSLTGAPF